MEAQQELFTELVQSIKKLGFAVYDGFLPPEGTAYPFVYVADFTQTDTNTKSGDCGRVHPVVHVWHNNPRQRGTVSVMLAQIKDVYRYISHTNNHSWTATNINQRIFADTTTKTPLLHGVIEADFLF